MSLALLTSSRLAHIQDMPLPNVVLYFMSLYLIFNSGIFFALRLLASRTDFFYLCQNEYLICYQRTSHKGFQSLH